MLWSDPFVFLYESVILYVLCQKWIYVPCCLMIVVMCLCGTISMWNYCLYELWNFQYIIGMNYFVFASRYKLYVCDLNYVYAEDLPDTTSWHKCQCICYIWGASSSHSDRDVWCSWWNFVFLDWLHCGTSGDLSCSECSDILHGSLEAW